MSVMAMFNSYPNVLLHALLQDRHPFRGIVWHPLVIEAPAIASLNAINVHECLTPHLQHRVRATKRMFRPVGIRVIGRNDFGVCVWYRPYRIVKVLPSS